MIFRQSLGSDGAIRILADQIPELDTRRYDNVWNLDLRLAKNFKFGERAFTLSADVFNVFNQDTVLEPLPPGQLGQLQPARRSAQPPHRAGGARFQF